MVSTRFGLIWKGWAIRFILKVGKVKPPKQAGMTLRHGALAGPWRSHFTTIKPGPRTREELEYALLYRPD